MTPKTKLPDEPRKKPQGRRQSKACTDNKMAKDLKQIATLLKDIKDILDNMWRERRP